MQRRDFLQRMGWGTLALGAMPLVSGPWYHGRPSAETPVLIYGGGAAGLCAGLQAARQGVPVTILEPSPWIGGMLTAAGVSALDGNKYGAGGGLVHDFRERLAAHYGSIEALFTGWISLYCYEPHIGHAILQDFANAEPNLTILYGAEAVGYERAAPNVRRVQVALPDGTTATFDTEVFLDATEYGDGLALAGIPYRLGRESRDELGESAAPDVADLKMQDLTYAATLVRRPGAAAHPTSPTERAYWDRFACSTQIDCPNPDPERLNHTVHDWESFITYAALPNDKYLLNWPHHSNDFPINVAFFEDRYYRQRHLAAAKLHTLQFVRYMQTALGHPEWQIAEDEYPTADHLPPIPYMRESRRLVNDHILVQDDLVPKGDAPRAPTIPNSIAVGDYFLDHHHSQHHLPPAQRLHEDFPDNGPFQVPPTVFFTDEDDRFLAGEKSIAISHIVNGSTRLQPVVMLMGQALGALAARAVQQGQVPKSVPVATVQQDLLDAGCQLFIMYDVPTGHPLFRPVQELALRGVFHDDTPVHLEPDAPMATSEAATWLRRAEIDGRLSGGAGATVQARDLPRALRTALPAGTDGVSRGAFVAALYEVLSAS